MTNLPSNNSPLQPNELALLASFLGLPIRDGKTYRGPNPFTKEGTDRFVLFPQGNGSERNGQIKYAKEKVFELAQSLGYTIGRNTSLPAIPVVSIAERSKASMQKRYDTRSLEERGLSKGSVAFFEISAPIGVSSGWGESRKFPTHHPDGREGRHRIKYRDPALQPTVDKQGKLRNPAKILWDNKTKSKGIPIAYACNLVKANDNVYLVNSELAVWLLWQEGVCAICPLGEGRSAKSFQTLCQCLKDKGIAKLVVLLDADEAGRSATKIALKAAHMVGVNAIAREWPTDVKHGFDASDFWEECHESHKPLAESLSRLTESELDLEEQLPQRVPPKSGSGCPPIPPILTAKELMQLSIPPIRWAVHGLIAEGLTIFAGAPKIGKSWMVLNLAVDIANGANALKAFPTTSGDVLYLALEDPRRRLQHRLTLVLQGATPPEKLHFSEGWPSFDQGGKELLREWLAAHPETRLVIVDTFKKLRRARVNKSDFYSEDYEHAAEFKAIADEFNVAIILVHHTTKFVSDDPLKDVSGSMGLTGAADSIIVLQRERNSERGKMFLTGRDIEEATLSFRWNRETYSWSCEGSYEMSESEKLGESAADMLNILREDFPEGATSGEWEAKSGLPRATFFRLKDSLTKEGLVVKGPGNRGKFHPQETETQGTHDTDEEDSYTGKSQSHVSIEDETLIPMSKEGETPHCDSFCDTSQSFANKGTWECRSGDPDQEGEVF